MLLAAGLSCAFATAQQLSDLATPRPLPPGTTLVIGFLGGYERWDDPHRSVRQLVLRLRQKPGVDAESLSNHNRSVALALLRDALDTNRDGRIEPQEAAAARIVLFGQSWGGAAAIALARDLQSDGIPVLLTVQVDSVGLHDNLIPPNVRAAINFYQHDPGSIWGRSQIGAADPQRTAILGNFRRSYVFRRMDESHASWARRVFGASHAKMELDPALWAEIEHDIDTAVERR